MEIRNNILFQNANKKREIKKKNRNLDQFLDRFDTGLQTEYALELNFFTITKYCLVLLFSIIF